MHKISVKILNFIVIEKVKFLEAIGVHADLWIFLISRHNFFHHMNVVKDVIFYRANFSSAGYILDVKIN